MGGVDLSLVGFILVVRSFKISKALTFTISRNGEKKRLKPIIFVVADMNMSQGRCLVSFFKKQQADKGFARS